MSPIGIGAIVLPEHGWERTRAVWRGLEELGLDHAWTYDHLSWRTLRDAPWYDTFTVLAAVAAQTSRIRLGTLVTSPNFREPVLLAKEVMTLDEISGGRFTLGIGAGATGADDTALGRPPLAPRERADRFAEFVSLTDLLLRQKATDFAGRYYTAVDARMVPGCVQRPRVPFALAASGPRGMRLAARYAACWVTIGDTAEPGGQDEAVAFALLRRQSAMLDAACEQEGRDPASLGRMVNLSRVVAEPCGTPERFADLVGRCEQLGFTDVVVNMPRPSGVFAGDPRGFEKAVRYVLDTRVNASGRP